MLWTEKSSFYNFFQSGVLQAGTCVIGPGVVVDPKVFLDEIDRIEKRGARTDHVIISDRAHIIMPYHIEMDKIRESVEDRIKIGTTKKGIGPCYADKNFKRWYKNG